MKKQPHKGKEEKEKKRILDKVYSN